MARKSAFQQGSRNLNLCFRQINGFFRPLHFFFRILHNILIFPYCGEFSYLRLHTPLFPRAGVQNCHFPSPYPDVPSRRGTELQLSLSIPRCSLAPGYRTATFPSPYPAVPSRRGTELQLSLSIPRWFLAAGYRTATFPLHTPMTLCSGLQTIISSHKVIIPFSAFRNVAALYFHVISKAASHALVAVLYIHTIVSAAFILIW